MVQLKVHPVVKMSRVSTTGCQDVSSFNREPISVPVTKPKMKQISLISRLVNIYLTVLSCNHFINLGRMWHHLNQNSHQYWELQNKGLNNIKFVGISGLIAQWGKRLSVACIKRACTKALGSIPGEFTFFSIFLIYMRGALFYLWARFFVAVVFCFG